MTQKRAPSACRAGFTAPPDMAATGVLRTLAELAGAVLFCTAVVLWCAFGGG